MARRRCGAGRAAHQLYLIDVALNECIGAVGEDLVPELDGLAEELAVLEL